MKSAAIVSALLGATAALAAPRSVAQPRGLRSASGQRAMSRPNMYKPTNETDTTYSTNWSGAVLVGTGFTSVTATMVVPKIPANSGGTKCEWHSIGCWPDDAPSVCAFSRYQFSHGMPEEGRDPGCVYKTLVWLTSVWHRRQRLGWH